ncbi:MAG TPA: glycosyltransferase [Phototrophicaceae bacterium]|nr:glycosyltransferase [Phototrophicaceae bacterium]
MRGDVQAMLSGSANMAEVGSNPIRLYQAVRTTFAVQMQDYRDAFSAAALRDSEVIINQLPANLFGYDLAEKLGVPYFSASVIPLYPTCAWPLPLFPQLPLGRLYNQLTYPLAEQLVWSLFRRAIQDFRRQLGLPPASYWGHFRQLAAQRIPVLNGFSHHVVPRPADWGDQVHITGYWLLDEPAWQPPDELARFLAAGAKPVFIGFGSMPAADAERLTTIILEAARLSQTRVVLSAGWANLGEQPLPDSIFKIGYVPYPWLFPQMAAIVHHGGSGTTGLALRAGVPSLIVPFAADQFYWGRRVVELGVGAEPIPHKKLTADNLAAALRLLTTDQPMQQRATELGEQLRGEDGVANAVEIIQRYLKT